MLGAAASVPSLTGTSRGHLRWSHESGRFPGPESKEMIGQRYEEGERKSIYGHKEESTSPSPPTSCLETKFFFCSINVSHVFLPNMIIKLISS